ncbi:MAG TPA: hypothetical protein VF549_15195 [Solirubrobacteraceae bacterium]|jgi:Tfp pilus assembly protein PilE
MRFIDRLRAERGMTVIELLVAAAVCAVGIAATIGVMDNSRALSVRSEKRDVLAHQAEREVERLMALPWTQFRHPTTPTASASPPGNPSTYISGTSYKWDRKTPAASEVMAVGTGGQVASTFTTWTDNGTRLSGRVYRYVTTIDPNSRRLTVIVTANGADAPPDLLISTIKTKPIL